MFKNLLLVLLATILLFGCGGGSGGSSMTQQPNEMPPSEQPAPPEMPPSEQPAPPEMRPSEQPAPPSTAEIKAAIINGNGSPIQEHIKRIVATGAEYKMVSQTWDGSNIETSIVLNDSTTIELNSATNSLEGLTRETSNSKSISMGAIVENRATLSRIEINWRDSERMDYLAGGYWLSVDNTNSQSPVAEAGVFIDGPEFNATPNLPSSGTATYNGKAHGLHTVVYNNRRGFRIGEFDGDATLTADFGNSTISGRIDNIYSTEESANVQSPRSTRPYVITLGTTPITNMGSFAGSVQITHPSDNVVSNGRWDGQFSNLPASMADPSPRKAAGTFGVSWVHSEGTQGQYIGVFNTDKQ